MCSPRWSRLLLVAVAVAAAAAAAACGDNRARPDGPPAPPVDAPAPQPDAPPDADPLATLAGTGLCVDAACAQIQPGIRAYAPRVSFWDDTATKRRWICLPPGTKIDTSDMDHWVFPVGTKIWKEFTRDGTRVETRLIEKQLADDSAPGAWFFATYQWNAAQDATTLVTNGVQNANGTQHDIPARYECRLCHDRLSTRVLGFDAIQLDYDAPAGMTDLEDLIAADLLTVKPAGASPHFPLPGTDVDRTALTYLHANCGHCHNPTSEISMGTTTIDLRLRTTALTAVTATPTYLTSVGKPALVPYTENGTDFTTLIIAGDPAHSAMYGRMTSMISFRFMPALAVEMPDPAGQAAISAWISSL
jgi:hypothetical protein